jgi:hypothetical protein
MSNIESQLNEWELKLEKQLQVLKQCQESKNFLGSETCEVFFD